MEGGFVSRRGGVIVCSARLLLRQLVRLEKSWRHYGDMLSVVNFGPDVLIIGDYFGRDFTIPLKAEGVAPPTILLRKYPMDVEGLVVLDVGAYLGDTPLMWMYKKAGRVVAVEPVPYHVRFIEMNCRGLPVETLNIAVGNAVPDIPSNYGSIGYGLEFPDGNLSKLEVPVKSLTELVSIYKPQVVKLNCEGCEHFVMKELLLLPALGVKRLVVDFHDIPNHEAVASVSELRNHLGDGKILSKRLTQTRSGEKRMILTVFWEF